MRRGRKKGEFLYKGIYDILRREILSGKHPAGGRIPSADILAETYSVNRLTVRKSLSMLAAEGLLYTRPAQGTYVDDSIEKALAGRASLRPAGKTVSVGIISRVVMTGMMGSYHSDILAGIHAELGRSRANMVLMPFNGTDSEASLFAHARKSGFDAAIYMGPFGQAVLKSMVESSVPSVILDFSMRNSGTDCITLDNRSGGHAAMEHLIAHGHRNIVVVTGDMGQPAAKERLAGAMEMAEEGGVKDIRTVEGDFTEKSGYDAVSKILESRDIPTAIFFMNDEMASGGIRAFRELSELKVPGDVSVIGFDNSSCSLATSPRLTTISAPALQMGRLAAQRVLERLRGTCSPCLMQLSPSLVERESVRRIKG